MGEGQQPRKIPLAFYQVRPGHEPVREWLKGLPEAERHAIGRDLLRAMAVARWDAALPAVGKRFVGDPDGPPDAPDSACAALSSRGAPGGGARVYQENANDAGR